jgi:hypothetical protein
MSTVWSHHGLIESLQRLAYFERGFAHVLAGWIPKVPQLHLKLGMASHFYEAMNQAHQIRQILLTIGHREPEFLNVAGDWPSIISSIDGLPTSNQVLSSLYGVLRPRLMDEYRLVLSAADALLDAHLLYVVQCYLPLGEAQLRWAQQQLSRERTRQREIAKSKASIEGLWDAPSKSSVLPLDHALPRPQHRAPAATRVDGLARGEPGAMPILPLDSLRDPKGIGIFLHNNINEEYTTLELTARNSYEHPELPWTFHLGMARQASDEARHAQILQRAAEGSERATEIMRSPLPPTTCYMSSLLARPGASMN